ncbi:UNKNOWN [Stylonychia lemnae]|uniref:Uncharacterized protein n=1 Tax=Stylonychia lemnae TaxID=5949 RepID=A0A078B7Q7_STYLE|nr:UNKNOWN [Stylonychia lemnae]|eukprot:CDW89588.1 UNKNOWN [Stylonychia lemnae]
MDQRLAHITTDKQLKTQEKPQFFLCRRSHITTQEGHNFPANVVFNFEQWRKEENYLQIVRDKENIDHIGNIGFYRMNKTFDLILVHEYEDEETKQELLDNIPWIEQFDIIVIEEQGQLESDMLDQSENQSEEIIELQQQ